MDDQASDLSYVDLTTMRGYGSSVSMRSDANRAEAVFGGSGPTFQLRAPLPETRAGDSGSVRLELSLVVDGWSSIRYLAYGLRTRAGRFIHVKNPHPQQGGEFVEILDASEYERTVEAFDASVDDLDGGSLEIFIYGVPAPSGGRVAVSGVRVGTHPGKCLDEFKSALESSSQRAKLRESLNPSFLAAFSEYNLGYYENDMSAARRFVETGEVALRQVTPIPGDWRNKAPPVADYTTTHRYLWHAQDLPRVLLVAFENERRAEYAEAAYGLISAWAHANLETKGQDQRYIWYDHGVGDRLITLVMLWCAGLELDWNADRLQLVSNLLVRHADLLASDWFYARNQVERWHNHGMFQDMALLSAGGLFAFEPDRQRWLEVASRRLLSQFQALVASDGSSVENSFGYHAATERMCWSSAQWLELAGTPDRGLRAVCGRMAQFTAAMTYPDGRGPSYGDSFRRGNSRSLARRSDVRMGVRSAKVFADSGYAVARGNRAGIPWQVTLIAPSKSRTHKHEDNLNVTYWAGGVEWLVDPGFFSHQYTDPVPAFARSFRAHNAPAVVSGTYSITPGLASLKELGNSEQRFAVRGESRAFDGWVVGRRMEVSRSDGTARFIDTVTGGGKPQWQHAFQFGEGVKADIRKDSIYLVYDAVGFSVTLHYPDAQKACRLYRGDAPESYGYTYPAFLKMTRADAAVCTVAQAKINWGLEITTR